MVLENKLGLTNSEELAKQEELLKKKRAKELFEYGKIEKLANGPFKGLCDFNKFLLQGI
ncbi:hypothetical protein [Streptococcus thoraltensis]